MDQADVVSLTYTATAEDIRHGMRVRARAATGLASKATLLFVVGLVAVALLVLLSVALTEGLTTRTWTWLTVYALMVAVILLVVPRTRKRQYQRVADQLGTTRVSVDDAGLRLEGPHGTSTNNWSAYGSFVETEQAFVLMSPDKKRIVFTMLPKRGLTEPSDAERLRKILARHVG